jgi:hypothetical protein
LLVLEPWPEPWCHPRAAELPAWRRSLGLECDEGDGDVEDGAVPGIDEAAKEAYEWSPLALSGYDVDGVLRCPLTALHELRLAIAVVSAAGAAGASMC